MIRKYKVVDILDGRLILAQNTDSLEKVVFKVLQKSAGRPYTSSEYSYHGDRRYFNVISVFCCNIRPTIYYHKKINTNEWWGGIYLYTSEKIIGNVFCFSCFQEIQNISSTHQYHLHGWASQIFWNRWGTVEEVFNKIKELLKKCLTRLRNCWISV